MVVQFLDGNFSTVYFGPIEPAIADCRFYEPSGCYELELSKARKLMAARAEGTKKLLIEFEGGAVYTAERNGQYLIIFNESTLLEMMRAEDREGINGVNEHSFPSKEKRDAYITMRGWSREV